MKMVIMMASRNVTSDATWRGRHILRHDSVKGLCVNKYLIHRFFPATYVILFFLSNGNPSFEDRLLYVPKQRDTRDTPIIALPQINSTTWQKAPFFHSSRLGPMPPNCQCWYVRGVSLVLKSFLIREAGNRNGNLKHWQERGASGLGGIHSQPSRHEVFATVIGRNQIYSGRCRTLIENLMCMYSCFI